MKKASLTASQHIDRIVDECERRATEKVKEAMLYGLNYKVPENKIFVSNDEIVQQFSKEQQNQEAITLLKEWKERDGSEIEENYNKLTKEQYGE